MGTSMSTAASASTTGTSPGKKRAPVFLWSLTAALAGFLFGFDTVVISGAEQTVQELWRLSAGLHGLAMGSALYGTVLGAMVGGWPADRFGRRPTLLVVGLLYFVSAVWSALATGVYSFSLARFLGGLGVGIATVAAPMYIAEIAPAARRGRLAGLFQLNIVLGILGAFCSNALIGWIGGVQAWRWMLGAEAAPALVYTWLCLVIPESPRWLLARRGDREQALAVLQRVEPDAGPEGWQAEADRILAASMAQGEKGPFWSCRLRRPILLAILIACFNQLSGINAVLYFAPRIFEWTGLGPQAALLQSVGIGLTNLVFTLIGLWLIDRAGRRMLLYVGSVGYILSLGIVALGFWTQRYDWVPPFIFAFIAAHAVGQGAVIWVFIAEIFPNRHRAEGQALGSFTHWLFAALLTTVFPKMAEAWPPATIFAFFCGMMILQLLWVRWMMPETRGVPLEEIQARLGWGPEEKSRENG